MSDFVRARDEGCLSDLRIDRALREEGDVAAARAHADACVKCQARWSELAALLASHRAAPPRLRKARRLPSLMAAATFLAAAAAVLLYVRAQDHATRAKGSGWLGLYVQHDGHSRRAAGGEVVAPGDTLQLIYSSAQPFYGAVLSLDGARHASAYFPDAPRAAALPAGNGVRFPVSTVLDDVLGSELLFALRCDSPVELAPLIAALPRRPPAAGGCEVERLEIEKR